MFAQNSTDIAPAMLKHEINLGFTNLLHRNEPTFVPVYPYYYEKALHTNDIRVPYPDYYQDQYTQPQFGLGYKFHINNWAARIQLAFGNSSSESESGEETSSLNSLSNEHMSMLIRPGIEYKFIKKERMHFYGAIDAIIHESDNTSESEQVSSGTTYSSSTETNYSSFGAGFSLGLRYFVHPNISLSAETRLDYLSWEADTKWKNEATGTSPSSYESKQNEEGSNIIVSPLGLFSINVHF
jgi:hypothetical protein